VMVVVEAGCVRQVFMLRPGTNDYCTTLEQDCPRDAIQTSMLACLGITTLEQNLVVEVREILY